MELVLGVLRRQVKVEFHLAAESGGVVGKLEQLTPKGGDGRLSRDRHCVGSCSRLSSLDVSSKNRFHGLGEMER